MSGQRLKIAAAKKEATKQKLEKRKTERIAAGTQVQSNSVVQGTALGRWMSAVEESAPYRQVEQTYRNVVASANVSEEVGRGTFRVAFWGVVWVIVLAILSYFQVGLLFVVASVLVYLWLATQQQNSSQLNRIVRPPTAANKQ
jgi:ascorbate-specific PTS system EIIC-type component UlaA